MVRGETRNKRRSTLLLAALIIALVGLLGFTAKGQADAFAPPAEPEGPEAPEELIWNDPVTLPTKNCYGAGTPNCQHSSPTLEDINEDGYLDIIVGTNRGHIVVVDRHGSILWDRDVAPFFGMSPNAQEIHSSPAVADIDADGNLEIVVGAGTIDEAVCTQGGVVVLDRWGNLEPGYWPQFAQDWAVPPAGCRDTIFSSPALGDMDNDGDLEIVVGGFDMRIYAWHHDGTPVDNFPIDSWLYPRYPWPEFVTHLADTVWSSPALADLNNDGYLEIVIGTDEGNMGNGWTCPYQLPANWQPGYCGGTVYVLDRFGNHMPGFPRHFLETIQSSPAIVDLDGNGLLDIVVGTGTWYRNNSPDHPTHGFRMYAMNNEGQDLPGWEGGKAVNGPVPASPVIGDIAGDEQPEVVVGVHEGKQLYAWHANGQPVSGFPMLPRDLFGNNNTVNFNVGSSFVLADFDGDAKMEIFFNHGWVVTIVNGDGYQLTSPFYPNSNRPVYFTEGTLLNTPVVGDLDNNGKLELIVNNSKLYAWELDHSTPNSDWPMFKMNAAGNPSFPRAARLSMQVDELLLYHDEDDSGPRKSAFRLLNLGDYPLTWTINPPPGVSVWPQSGTIAELSETVVNVTIARSPLHTGYNELGSLVINATAEDGGPADGSPEQLNLRVFLGPMSTTSIPATSENH